MWCGALEAFFPKKEVICSVSLCVLPSFACVHSDTPWLFILSREKLTLRANSFLKQGHSQSFQVHAPNMKEEISKNKDNVLGSTPFPTLSSPPSPAVCHTSLCDYSWDQIQYRGWKPWRYSIKCKGALSLTVHSSGLCSTCLFCNKERFLVKRDKKYFSVFKI